ncbi:hypothetical protein L596_018824 [Steinernema carpocapsae]|uniref:PAN2-PAN3 deadenylation complex subunit PAN3 n=1 Tax=Steinernema carpocapsae TaxID=34508 RepID=A0A4U5N5T3_STECR|nr:hypothetical protein L596_018824 [Steinernema carpocapsae]
MQATPHDFRSFEPSSSCASSTVAPSGSRLAQYFGTPGTPQQSSTTSSPRHSGWPQLVSQQSLYSTHSRNNTNSMSNMMQSFGHLNVANNGVKAATSLNLSRGGFPPLSANGSSPPDNDSSASAPNFVQENFGGTTYFYRPPQNDPGANLVPNGGTTDPYASEPSEFLAHSGGYVYSGALPFQQKQHRKNAGASSSFFINPDLRMELLKAQMAIQSRMDPSSIPDVPATVDHYHGLSPMVPPKTAHLINGASINGDSRCNTFKAFSIKDGTPYILKRAKFRNMLPKTQTLVDGWKKISHSNIISLRECVPTKAFGDASLLFVYDYHPLAESLEAKHFGRNGAGGQGNGGIMEPLIWSYIIQITSALRHIHQQGLAARTLSLEKILVTGRQKILLSDCATVDVLSDSNPGPAQQDDLMALGRVVICLAVGSPTAAKVLPNSMHYINTNYSTDLKNLIYHLLNSNVNKNVNELMPMIGARFYVQLESAQAHNDYLESELSKELENGRLFRLMAKINSIVERPELNMDPTWSETGDRFLLKLFRDYLFHQVNEQGKPWMDLAHIVSCLNKLDAGVQDKVQLVSRDQENVLIVSYADLRRCFDAAFKELLVQQNAIDGFSGCV